MTEITQHACIGFLRLASMSHTQFFCRAVLQLAGSQGIYLLIELITLAILLCRNTKSKEYLRFSLLNITNHIQSRSLRDSHCMACVGLIFFTSLFMTTLFFFLTSLFVQMQIFFSHHLSIPQSYSQGDLNLSSSVYQLCSEQNESCLLSSPSCSPLQNISVHFGPTHILHENHFFEIS